MLNDVDTAKQISKQYTGMVNKYGKENNTLPSIILRSKTNLGLYLSNNIIDRSVQPFKRSYLSYSRNSSIKYYGIMIFLFGGYPFRIFKNLNWNFKNKIPTYNATFYLRKNISSTPWRPKLEPPTDRRINLKISKTAKA